MTSVELILLLLLAILGLPPLFQRWGVPTLVQAAFLGLGILVAPHLAGDTRTVLREVGELGFVLLLFTIGLEIDLPSWKDLRAPLAKAGLWAAVNFPAAWLLAALAGLAPRECLIAAAALTGVSLSLVFRSWQFFPGLSAAERQDILLRLISLEVMALAVLSAADVALKAGLGPRLFWTFASIGALLVALFFSADWLARHFTWLLDRFQRWRTHLMVVLVLLVAAAGERIGLSAAKTAFFFGLFISRFTHEGWPLEHSLAPLTQRLLFPFFFMSLGAMVPLSALLSWTALLALGSAIVLLGVRRLFDRYAYRTAGVRRAYHLHNPNLTIAAVGAAAFESAKASPTATVWLLLTSVFLTLYGLARLPDGTPPAPRLAPEPVPPDASESVAEAPADSPAAT